MAVGADDLGKLVGLEARDGDWRALELNDAGPIVCVMAKRSQRSLAQTHTALIELLRALNACGHMKTETGMLIVAPVRFGIQIPSDSRASDYSAVQS